MRPFIKPNMIDYNLENVHREYDPKPKVINHRGSDVPNLHGTDLLNWSVMHTFTEAWLQGGDSVTKTAKKVAKVLSLD